jgi:hypothetical protein
MIKYVLASALCGITLLVSAQITLNQNNVPHSASYSDVRAMNSSGIAVPMHGANVLYDYSALPMNSIDTIPYIPATRAGFTSYTRFNYSSSGLSGFQLISEYYTQKTNDGIAQTATFKIPQSFGIGAISGTATDSLIFPGGTNTLAQVPYDIKFPATYGSTWSANFKYVTEFALTVSGFGLNNAPGEQKQHVAFVDSVVGWGMLTLPTSNGASIFYDVLLVKESLTTVDSVFLSGSPAPAQLLSAFGLTQGQIGYRNRYYFYSPNFERPLLSVEMSANWQTAERSFHAATGLISAFGLDEQDNLQYISVYPMPAKAGARVTFAVSQVAKQSVLKVYDATGKCLNQATLLATDAGLLSWLVPADLPAGLYTYQLIGDNDVQSGKLLVE